MNPNPERKIATREDWQLFWTNIMWSEDQESRFGNAEMTASAIFFLGFEKI